MSTELKERMHAALKSARDISEKYPDGADIVGEDLDRVTAHLKEYGEAKKAFVAAQEASKASESVKAALADIGFDLGLERSGDAKGGMQPSGFVTPSKQKSIGRLFTESVEYKALMDQFGSGHINEKSRVQSAPMGLKALLTGASDTSGGAFVQNDVSGVYEALGRRPLTIRDLVSVRQTTSDTVEFVRQTTQPTSAAPVAEATTSAAPTAPGTAGALVLAAGGGYKPEGSFAFEKVTTAVKTIAEWVPATKRGLADASQLRGLIDDELRADLAEEEEDQILNGDGTGENFTGIRSTTNVQLQAYSATVTDLDPLIETSLRAKTLVRTVGRSVATGYVFNPADWETIQLARLAKNPNNEAVAGAVPTLHGLPVVESEAQPVGEGLVGDFRKAVIWDREQASITATDSHADFFIRNLVAILGEERLAFGVTRPTAFVKIDLTA